MLISQLIQFQENVCANEAENEPQSRVRHCGAYRGCILGKLFLHRIFLVSNFRVQYQDFTSDTDLFMTRLNGLKSQGDYKVFSTDPPPSF